MNKKWSFFSLLTAGEGIISLIWILKQSSESGNSILFGLSRVRLLMAAAVLVLILTAIMIAVCLFFRKEKISIEADAKIQKFTGWLSAGLAYIVILACFFLTPPMGVSATAKSYYEHLKPVCAWALIFAVQSFLFLEITHIKKMQGQKKNSGWHFCTLILFILSVIFILSAWFSGLGMKTISGTFYRQGVSLLEGQVIVSLFISFPLVILFEYFEKNLQNKGKTTLLPAIGISALIWVIGAYVWIHTPFEGRSYFLPALRGPNYNFYPSSDAENYDLLAQSVIIGNGFRNGMTVARPLYIVCLAFLHSLTGNDYIKTTNLQIIILALFPVFLYWIGRKIHHPVTGILAAALAIFREYNSILATSKVHVSNSRLFMTDLPMAMMVSLVILALLWWKENDSEKKIIPALMAGGTIGAGMLIRTQFVVMVPAAIIFYVLARIFTKKWKWQDGVQLVVMLFGCALVFSPWTIWNRIHPNESLTGDTSESNYLLRLYERAATGETIPNNVVIDKSLFSIVKEHPGNIFQAFCAHFVNNEISTLLVLPVRTEKVQNSEEWFSDSSLFWYRESSRDVLKDDWFLILIYLLLICWGIGKCFQKSTWNGLLPLWIHLVYNGGTAAAMNSGFRFVLPVDWIGYFYFGAGCIGVFQDVCCLMDSQLNHQVGSVIRDRRKKEESLLLNTAMAIIALAAVGAILPMCEILIPYRYAEKTTQKDLLAQWSSLSQENGKIAGQEKFKKLFDEGQITFLKGRAVYPRFYKAGEGDSGGSSSAKTGLPYDRLVWILNDHRVHVISMPASAAEAEKSVPDPADMIAVGCQKGDYFEAFSVEILSDEGKLISEKDEQSEWLSEEEQP